MPRSKRLSRPVSRERPSSIPKCTWIRRYSPVMSERASRIRASSLRITAARLGLKAIRARGRHEDSDSALEEQAAQGEDPELALIRAEYRPVFKTSFQTALDALEDRERLLLKQHFLDGLTVDQ